MIQLDGALRVKKIHQSKNGPFAVGTLSTPVGTFKVKDQVLDQFDEGTYQVTAWVAEIFLGQYVASGGFSVTEMRVRLYDLQVRSEDQNDQGEDHGLIDPDPLDEVRSPTITSTRPVNTPSVVPEPASAITLSSLKDTLMNIGRKRKPVKVEETPAADYSASFPEDLWTLIQARQPVKLDATAERTLFRQQTVLLQNDLGYKFHALDQTFYPA